MLQQGGSTKDICCCSDPSGKIFELIVTHQSESWSSSTISKHNLNSLANLLCSSCSYFLYFSFIHLQLPGVGLKARWTQSGSEEIFEMRRCSPLPAPSQASETSLYPFSKVLHSLCNGEEGQLHVGSGLRAGLHERDAVLLTRNTQ